LALIKALPERTPWKLDSGNIVNDIMRKGDGTYDRLGILIENSAQKDLFSASQDSSSQDWEEILAFGRGHSADSDVADAPQLPETIDELNSFGLRLMVGPPDGYSWLPLILLNLASMYRNERFSSDSEKCEKDFCAVWQMLLEGTNWKLVQESRSLAVTTLLNHKRSATTVPLKLPWVHDGVFRRKKNCSHLGPMEAGFLESSKVKDPDYATKFLGGQSKLLKAMRASLHQFGGDFRVSVLTSGWQLTLITMVLHNSGYCVSILRKPVSIPEYYNAESVQRLIREIAVLHTLLDRVDKKGHGDG